MDINYLFCVLLAFQPKNLAAVTLTGSSSYAVLDNPFRFTCEATGTTDVTLLGFKRAESAAVCTIGNPFSPSSCQQFIADPGYSCSCGQSGVYYMNISSVSLQEDAQWECEVSPRTSDPVSLSVYYGPFKNVTISKSSPVTVIENVTTESIQCSAQCNPGCIYTWRKGNQQVSDNRDLPLGGLTRDKVGDYRCTARNTATGATSDSPTLTVNIQWYPSQPTHNCSSWIVLGQPGSCTCQTSDPGNPAGTVQWTGSSSPVLNLANIPRSDNGKNYICRAANSLTNSDKDTVYTVNIAFGPTRISITGNQQTDAPDVLTLTCTTDNVNPTPTLTWRNSTDGTALSGSSPAPVGSPQDGGRVYRSTLPITTQWYQDGDTIVCEGSNPRIQSQQTVTDSEVLDVIYPPQSQPVISGLSSSPIYEGDSVTIICRVTGGKPLVTTVTLLCPGGHQNSTTTTEGSNTRLTTVTFPVTRALRSQPCRCSAVHSTGRYQETANWTKDNVYYPPSIQTVSVSPSFPWLEGRAASLTCVLSDTGHPRSAYIWYRNGGLDIQQTGQTWQFSSLSHTDNGRQIYCQAENQFTEHKGSTVKSSNVTLSVYFSPKVQSSPSSSVTKIEGDSLNVDCTAASNPPPTGYQWTYASVTQPSGPRLSFSDLDRTDHGDYRCTVTTQAGSYGSLTGTATVKVIVNYFPDLTLTNVTKTEPQTATVTCLADGRPENFNFSPFVHTWNGQVIRRVTGVESGRQYQKEFPSSSYQDTGVYVCEVNNGIPDRHGVIEHKGNISVQIQSFPKLTVGMASESLVGAEVGEVLILFRTFYSLSNITKYTWKKNEQTLNSSRVSDTTVKLDIYGVEVEDMGYNVTLHMGLFNKDIHPGQYSLQVCNSVGCESSTINLTAAGPPLTPAKFNSLENATKTSVWLSWKPGFPGGVYSQEFILEYRKSGGNWEEFRSFHETGQDVMVVEVNNLSPGMMYEFRLYAKNTRESKNRSGYTDVIQQATKEEVHSSTSIVGPVVGSIAGVLILVVIAAGVIVFYRKGYRCSCAFAITKQGNQNGRNEETPETDAMAYARIGPGESQKHLTYESLENKTSAQYTELKIYENTKGSFPEEKAKFPATYETVHTYENAAIESEEPPYVNTKQH